MNRFPLFLGLVLATGSLGAAPWTYRGSLDDGGQPASGQYDLRLSLLDESGSKTVVMPITLYAVTVRQGQFSVEVDFGVDLANAPALRLQTEVQQGGSGFVALGKPTRFDAKAALAGVCWDTQGNAGTNPVTDFIGTTDNQPLVLRTRNVQSLRIEPSAELFLGLPITANVIAGSQSNSVTAGVRGATIAGGGMPIGESDPNFSDEGPNLVTDAYGSIGGGYNNRAGDAAGTAIDRGFASVGGGKDNQASSIGSTVGGGMFNKANDDDLHFVRGFSTVGGGDGNTASAGHSTVGGGRSNAASGEKSFVGGGGSNVASGFGSTVAGGGANSASGGNSMISGGDRNCAGGSYSWAGGFRAKVRLGSFSGAPGIGCSGIPVIGDGGDEGSFVWADFHDQDFVSTGEHQFLIRATNGLGLNTNSPTPSHLTIGKDDGTNNVVALGYLADVTRWRIGGVGSGTGAAFEVQSGGDQVLLRVEDVGSASRVGISRTAVANTLEVEGGASKSTAGSWVANSDARIKTDVHEIDGALERLMSVRPVTFRYTPEYRAAHPAIPDQTYYNVIAQEFARTFPDAVKASGEYLPGQQKSRENEILQVDIHPALITTIAAVQELALQLETERALLTKNLQHLTTENAALRDTAAQTEARLARLEALLGTADAGAR